METNNYIESWHNQLETTYLKSFSKGKYQQVIRDEYKHIIVRTFYNYSLYTLYQKKSPTSAIVTTYYVFVILLVIMNKDEAWDA